MKTVMDINNFDLVYCLTPSTFTSRRLNQCVSIINRFESFDENLLGKSFTFFVESELRSFDPISTISGLATELTERVMNMFRCSILPKHSDSPRIVIWQDIISET
ncbi:Spectrin beta chain [Schistosoma japonicum]|nr:Spectrin beta chain [Schistosoma japonicum]